MRRVLPLIALLTACKGETGVRELRREVSTELVTLDIGQVAVGDREPLSIYLLSTGAGDATVFDVSVEDPDHWGLSESWSEGGESLKIDRGTPSSPSYGLIEIVFKPDTEGLFRTVMTVTSDDTEVTERDENNNGLWKVVLRGIGRYPCGAVYPDLHDFGSRPAGGYFTATSTLENCGGTLLTVADFAPEALNGGASSFSVSTPTPIYVLPGQSKDIEFAFEPAGGSPPAASSVGIVSNAPSLEGRTVELIGNDCEDSADAGWDADGDGWFACGGDCNDRLAEVSPSAVERPDNSVDDDCDGEVDEPPNEVSTDDDGDGFTESEGDCDDADSGVHPDAIEMVNQVDDDCNGVVDDDTENSDDDGDGFSERTGDCDDADPAVHPGAEELVAGVDDDCDGQLDEGSETFDDDGDGASEGDPEPDCNDDDPWTYPGADEDCDGLDNDCDGLVDEGEDDEDQGACGFLVERREAAAAAAPDEGCATATAPAALGLGALGLLLAAGRRRRES